MKRWEYVFFGEGGRHTFNMRGVEANTVEEAAAAIRAKHGAGEIVFIKLIHKRRESKSNTSLIDHSETPDGSETKSSS